MLSRREKACNGLRSEPNINAVFGEDDQTVAFCLGAWSPEQARMTEYFLGGYLSKFYLCEGFIAKPPWRFECSPNGAFKVYVAPETEYITFILARLID